MRKKIAIVLVFIFSFFFVGCGSSGENEINISVAASLVDPIEKLSEEFTKNTGIRININSGGSGTLKKQISSGADVGLFISANERYTNELIEEGLIDRNNKFIKLKNRLVLIGNEESTQIKDLTELKNMNQKIAIGEPSIVPAGEYAKQVLDNLGEYQNFMDRFIFCKDVTAVRSYVERGEVEFGFVYKSDTINMKEGKVLIEVDDNLHNEILYVGGLVKGYENNDECNEFLQFITSSEGYNVFKQYGFELKE